MILEAFSNTLKAEFSPTRRASVVLRQWLLGYLSQPNPASADKVHCILVAELELTTIPSDDSANAVALMQLIQPKSPTGLTLLKSLVFYCDSFEHWHYRRWLHQLNASDFKEASA
jgi:hypothetical protein